MTLPPGTPDLAVLDLLVSVADTGSLGAAARRHGISQPAASMRISALERRLRLRLLDRGPTGSVLTEAGRVAVEQAREVLAAARSFTDTLTALSGDHTPRVRVASSKTIADHRVPQWLAALRAVRPEVTVALEVGNSRQVEAMVRDGSADIGFVEGPHPPVGLADRVLGADHLLVIVGPEHPWARRARPLGLRELAATPLLWREPGSGTRDTVWEILAAHCRPAPPAAELGSAVAILEAVRTGLAPAVLSALIAAPELAAGRVVEVPVVDAAVLTRRFRAIWRREAPPSGAAETLAACAARIESARTAADPG
ncbi:LysR family transcriptional regulator [Nocardia farcinica]|uniref:LysR family transcriptional regulator n=1 Tax=Nocardia farcinica TaxID=37329 RepID=UPI001892F110|nr:LysR family transcriptional regulator [Nocardia farcinica]MBF6261559.1 LysR family transcriptional regulator [Nocardia farcinica]MBF6280098.1 LysR family transcriptional regulator [Nocardia farcinica]MBF6305446.1 LysR family transcriptional regulator [Nocardia farcinica]MBF6391485.1 LysR family transcriptional regulator [Nocardia farcinica]MBF6492827.1 LysR family transcriptional regulator [Nocardia farcinica]